MPLAGQYEPSAPGWAQGQTERIMAAGDTAVLGDKYGPVVLVTYRGRRTGKLRRMPLMRVEHEGTYAIVASLAGAEQNPVWYANVLAEPQVELQDGTVTRDFTARELRGDERALWWERAVAAFPRYTGYQRRTRRRIPVFVLEPRGTSTTSTTLP